jgi:hypothetical protein
LALVFVVNSGCQEEHDLVSQDNNLAPEVKPLLKGGPNSRPQAWVDCELFDGVVAPATFNPQSDPFDELYAGGNGFNGFKGGVPLVSESKPGDRDYNGGRWHKNVLRVGVDPNKYVNANACSVEDLDLNDFQSTGDYFECPLLPRRRNN